MSAWDSKNGVVVRWKPERIEGYENWWTVDCGCCNGICWGGEEPIECRFCMGRGTICVHRPSGTLAEWPGGPLLGKDDGFFTEQIDAGAGAVVESPQP